MNTIYTAILGLGNQEILLISLWLVAFGFVVWSVIDVLWNTTITDFMKLAWIAAILFFPYFGALVYLYFGRSKAHLAQRAKR